MKKNEKITSIEQNFSKWYTDVLIQGNLIEYGPVKGMLMLKSNSFGIWENIQKKLNKIFKNKGIKNVYLPLLMPYSYILKEKKHLKGFNPELAFVTRVGNKNLSEPYVIRPTSELLFCKLFEKELKKDNKIPLLYNQWVNIIRWEKTTNPFLRNNEFLWQEGHSIHSNSKQAKDFAFEMILVLQKFLHKYLAIPTIVGQKTEKEKFAGAEKTFTIEAMMKDGKALQCGTSHYLGQNFTKVMDVKFKNSKNIEEYAYHCSWGVSTRLIGAIIMVHGDDNGIIIPPKIAPTQVAIIDVFGNKNVKVRQFAKSLYKKLQNNWRVSIDISNKSLGFKANQTEIEGVPLRIEIGPEDIKNNVVTISRRDTHEKEKVKVSELENKIETTLESIHTNLLKKATQKLKNNIVHVNNYEDLKKNIELNKFVIAPFCGREEDEEKLKNETCATTRCIPYKYVLKNKKNCVLTKIKTSKLVLFAKAY